MFVHVDLLYVRCLRMLSCCMLDVCVSCPVICSMFVHVDLLYVRCLCMLSCCMLAVCVCCPVVC